jgi:hypothetical protein
VYLPAANLFAKLGKVLMKGLNCPRNTIFRLNASA